MVGRRVRMRREKWGGRRAAREKMEGKEERKKANNASKLKVNLLTRGR